MHSFLPTSARATVIVEPDRDGIFAYRHFQTFLHKRIAKFESAFEMLSEEEGEDDLAVFSGSMSMHNLFHSDSDSLSLAS